MYDELKHFQGKIYTGMRVGKVHHWNYDDGHWYEKKISPDEWQIRFNSIKTRTHMAPSNSGAKVGTKYHWYIVADQIATKLDKDTYDTRLKGLKFKVGHKRPNWKSFSYNYSEQLSYKEKVIEILERVLEGLKNEEEPGIMKFIKH
jgi:hypothetical protein